MSNKLRSRSDDAITI